MYMCAVGALIQSCRPTYLASYLWKRNNKIWTLVDGPPVKNSACVSVHDSKQLLAIGGKNANNEPMAAVYMYHPATNKWEVISHMTSPRYDCVAAVLPDGELMVVGGGSDKLNDSNDSTECATFD